MYTSTSLNQDKSGEFGQNQTGKGQKVADDVREGVNRVRDRVSEAAHDVKAKAGEVKHDLNDMAREAGENVRETLDRVTDKVTTFSHQTEDHIREKPVQSALIALAVGFVAGVFATRR